MSYPIVSSDVDGDDVEYGVNDFKLIFRLFNGVDVGKPVSIGTEWSFDVPIKQKPIVTPTQDIDHGQLFCDSADANKPKYMKTDGSVIDLSTGAPNASTTVKGIVELATNGESAALLVPQANDSRLSDARTPTAHTHLAADIPSTIAYENESNVFSVSQRFDDYKDDKIISAPASPATGFTRRYSKQIDSNNDGIFVKRKLGGQMVEVQVG